MFTEYVDAIQAGKDPLYPSFFFPSHISPLARSLIVQLLHPDPNLRLTATVALKHRWFSSANSRPNLRLDENSIRAPTPRQLSPKNSKVSGKPPRPSSGNGSPNQVSTLMPINDSCKFDSALIPSLSRNNSNNDLPGQPGTKLTESPKTQPEEKYLDLTPNSLNNEEDYDVDINTLNLSSSDQVIYVEDDGDGLIDDSIWRDVDDIPLPSTCSIDNSPTFS